MIPRSADLLRATLPAALSMYGVDRRPMTQCSHQSPHAYYLERAEAAPGTAAVEAAPQAPGLPRIHRSRKHRHRPKPRLTTVNSTGNYRSTYPLRTSRLRLASVPLCLAITVRLTISP